jgi:hypothetical protein
MLPFTPKFLGQAFLGQNMVNPASRGDLQLLVDSIDSSVSALPEGPIKNDFSERLIGCKNLLSMARDFSSMAQANSCLALLRQDVMAAPKSVTAPSTTTVIQSGILGIPTWALVVGALGVGTIGYLLSRGSGKVRVVKIDAHNPIKVEPRKDGTCRKGSRHMRDRTGCWSAKALD